MVAKNDKNDSMLFLPQVIVCLASSNLAWLPSHDLPQNGKSAIFQQITNRTHVSRTPKPEYLIALVSLLRGPLVRSHLDFWLIYTSYASSSICPIHTSEMECRSKRRGTGSTSCDLQAILWKGDEIDTCSHMYTIHNSHNCYCCSIFCLCRLILTTLCDVYIESSCLMQVIYNWHSGEWRTLSNETSFSTIRFSLLIRDAEKCTMVKTPMISCCQETKHICSNDNGSQTSYKKKTAVDLYMSRNRITIAYHNYIEEEYTWIRCLSWQRWLKE